ncbi:tetrathionate reductase family octaheme c-type cytochrome [Endothiovibrio diazotrophicus]
MNTIRLTGGFALALVAAAFSPCAGANTAPAVTDVMPVTSSQSVPLVDYSEPRQSTADHSKFEQLQVEFASGPEVTKACLSCHTEAAKQVQHTKHWTWEYRNPVTRQTLGKKHIINNFCTATSSNETFCMACHVGYGWKDGNFDFSEANQEAVDCLVCHDTTGKYKKLPGLAGHPSYEKIEWPPHSGKFREATDLRTIAQSVGKTSRRSCGACHFFGGGGNAVKHGDLDSSLTNPKHYLDVHMEADGLDFSCGNCHLTDSHKVAGSRYAPTASDQLGILIRGKKDGRNPTTCQACHGDHPHPVSASPKLNQHTDKVACQTCHIPEYARGPLATKMTWDWSTAGRLDENGHRIQTKGSDGRVIYDSKKGDFTYERYVIPEYVWFNGDIKYTLFGDRIDPTKPVQINQFQGSPDDGQSRIWPVKTFRGKQPYDAGLMTLAVFHTAGDDDAAYWGNYDWEKAMKAGMASRGVEYSGKMGFVETEMRWPITHMVAPKEDALRCEQCHKKNGRLEGVEGVYLPGRDNVPWIDLLAWLAALGTLIGVLIHGGIRILMSKRG